MVVVINGKRKTTISASLLTAKSIHFSVAYASYNELNVKVGDEIVIEDEKCYLSSRDYNRNKRWAFSYNGLDFRFIDEGESVRLVQVINYKEYACKNFSVEFN